MKKTLSLATKKEASEMSELVEKIQVKQFTIKDIGGVSYRMITHWAGNDLLLFKKEEAKWKKFSFADIVWIKIIQELRDLDVSLSIVEKMIHSSDKGEKYFSKLSDFIATSIVSRKALFLIVEKDGKCKLEYRGHMLVELEGFMVKVRSSCIVISIFDIIKKLVANSKYYESGVLANRYAQILQDLEKGKLVSITINQERRDIDLLKRNSANIKEKLVEYFLKGNYKRITIRTIEGDQLTIKL